jgi:prepilin-type N-terminal cleavage/methylation domain-containing protein
MSQQSSANSGGGAIASRRSRSRRSARGFTLVELLMATTAGLVVSAAAFLLAKNAAAVFQEEARITAAQLSASLGLQRIAGDLSRAGFLTTPNIQKDNKICNEAATWPLAVSGLKAVRIDKDGSVLAHGGDLAQSVSNGFSPDSITISSSFESAEAFPIRSIQSGGGLKTVYLQTASHPMSLFCKGKTPLLCAPELTELFKKDRLFRIETGQGIQIFGVIGSLSVLGNDVMVQLQPAPVVPTDAQNPNGYPRDCLGCKASVVSVVRYELQSLAGDPQYGALVAPVAASATGDNGRTELVRVELDKDENIMAGSLELVAEFAVDLKFGISTVDLATSVITDLPIAVPANANIYTTPPERIRSVHVRFSTRARVPDRDTDILGGPDGRRHRFQIPVFGKLAYARMRTLYTEVALQSLARTTW